MIVSTSRGSSLGQMRETSALQTTAWPYAARSHAGVLEVEAWMGLLRGINLAVLISHLWNSTGLLEMAMVKVILNGFWQPRHIY
jgi:hypothetical protein